MFAENGVGLPFDGDWFAADHATSTIYVEPHLDCIHSIVSMFVSVGLWAIITLPRATRGRMGNENFATEFDQSVWIRACHG